jgi:guanylate kinase
MQEAHKEIAHFQEFDYLVVNDVFDQALSEIRALITTLRLRRTQQQPHLAHLLNGLQGENPVV